MITSSIERRTCWSALAMGSGEDEDRGLRERGPKGRNMKRFIGTLVVGASLLLLVGRAAAEDGAAAAGGIAEGLKSARELLGTVLFWRMPLT